MPQIMLTIEALLFASAIFLNISRKNRWAVAIYATQSLAIAAALAYSAFRDSSVAIAAVAAAVFAVKVVVAPHFMRRLVASGKLQSTASTYLNVPLTVLIMAALSAFAFSGTFRPLSAFAAGDEVFLAVAMVLVSAFLIVNRKGAASQMIGVLSLENAIVSFALVAGLEQGMGLQLGVIFDVLVWVIIAAAFVSYAHRAFGPLDVGGLNELKEE